MLGCVAALQLVTQLAQQAGPAATQLLDSSLMPNLVRLARSSDNGMLKGRALRVSVAFADASCGACRQIEFDQHASGGRLSVSFTAVKLYQRGFNWLMPLSDLI